MLAGYNYKNLASITLQNAGLTTDTTITIPTSDASILPQTPFYATIMPVTQLANNSNSEIIIATGSTTSGTNTILSVTRAQRNTSAISWNAGEAVLTQAVYVEDIPNYIAGDNITIENEVISFDGGAETVSNTTPSSSFTLDTLSGSPISLSVYGDTYQQTYTGKNLLSVYNVGEITRNGITMTANSDGSLTFNGTCTGSAFSVKCSDTMDTVLPQGSYTYSRNADISGISGLDIIIYKNTGVRIGSSNNDNSLTFTSTGSDIQTYYIWAYISVGTTFDNYTIRPQIEAGTTATSFEPYVGGIPSPNPDYPQAVQVVTGEQTVTITDGSSESQSFEINLGKNWLNTFTNHSAGWSATSQGVTYTLNEDGTITANGTSTGDSYVDFVTTAKIPGGISKTVARVAGGSFSEGGLVRARAFSSSYGYDRSVSLTNDGIAQVSNTYSVDSSYSVFRLAVNQGTTVSNLVVEFMVLDSNETDYSYAEYFTPIELCKIGDYQDYIYKNNGNWYVHKEINKITLDGQTGTWESWGVALTNTLSARITGITPTIKSNASDSTVKMVASDKLYVTIKQSEVYDRADYPCFSTAVQNLYIRVLRSSLSEQSLNGIKNYISSILPVVYYVLSTATDTQITNTTLISQLEAISLYAGVNAITVNSANLPGLLLLTSYANTINGKLAKLLAE